MDAITLIRALEDLDLEPCSYSGRGMYGQKCVGVPTDNITEFTLGVWLALALGEEANQLHARVDGLGRGMIVYFPSVSWPGNDF